MNTMNRMHIFQQPPTAHFYGEVADIISGMEEHYNNLAAETDEEDYSSDCALAQGVYDED